MWLTLALSASLRSQVVAAPPQAVSRPAEAPEARKGAPSVLFIGNSYTFGYGSAVRFFRSHTVEDLNGDRIGGVPALFKIFALQAGRDFAVSLETSGGKNLDWHLENRSQVIGRAWDFVVMQGQSMLDNRKPGDPGSLVRSARQLAELLRNRNPKAEIRLMATWSRADQTYGPEGHWRGQPIEKMALDLRAGYDQAAASTPAIRTVIAVGEAWNRAIRTGVADANPYDGIEARKVNLWCHDHNHASTYGYYLEALMAFGSLTGLDPRSLGKSERAAMELGMSPEEAVALQQVAYDQLLAAKDNPGLKPFTPVPPPRHWPPS
jgi:hypothetical protein